MDAAGQLLELHIFGGYYKLWDVTQSQYAGTQYTAPGGSTAGWRNIGLRAGIGADTYIDGASTGIGGALLGVNQAVKFGSLGVNEGAGLRLFDNLNYLRSFNRTGLGLSGGYPINYEAPAGEYISGANVLCKAGDAGSAQVQLLDGGPDGTPFMPRVKTTGFDGVMAQSMFELVAIEDEVVTSLAVEYEEDSTRARHFTEEGERTEFYLVNARRGTAIVVSDQADGLVDEEGELVAHDESLLPGVAVNIHIDAVGAVNAEHQNDPYTQTFCWGDGEGTNTIPAPIYALGDVALSHGDGHPDRDTYAPVSPPVEEGPTFYGESADLVGDGSWTAGSDTCCFSGDNPADSQNYVTQSVDIGQQHNGIELVYWVEKKDYAGTDRFPEAIGIEEIHSVSVVGDDIDWEEWLTHGDKFDGTCVQTRTGTGKRTYSVTFSGEMAHRKYRVIYDEDALRRAIAEWEQAHMVLKALQDTLAIVDAALEALKIGISAPAIMAFTNGIGGAAAAKVVGKGAGKNVVKEAKEEAAGALKEKIAEKVADDASDAVVKRLKGGNDFDAQVTETFNKLIAKRVELVAEIKALEALASRKPHWTDFGKKVWDGNYFWVRGRYTTERVHPFTYSASRKCDGSGYAESGEPKERRGHARTYERHIKKKKR